MKITLLVSMLAIIILTIIGCDNEDIINSESNITEVAEKYKTIVVPMVKEGDILYSPIAEAYKNITVPIVQASDLQ